LTSPATPNDEWAHDLWDIVVGVHLADRFARRHPADDHWTRHIDIVLPVSDPDRWTGTAQAILANLLEVSTGDQWTLHLRQRRRERPFAEVELGATDAAACADHVALYSGGLDSTAYAALMAQSGTDTVFVTYTRARLRPIQDTVFAAIRALGDSARLRRIRSIPMQPVGTQESELESTSRSRGLLYTTTALYVAAAYGARTVAIPENGQLAINPPLSPARASSCSTRSVHPWVVYQLNTLINELGGQIEVVNPLLRMTKGDVCNLALEAGLTANGLFSTLSCGKPPFFHDPARAQQCGLCVACLLRRSGLNSALGYDRTVYEEPVPAVSRETLTGDIAALARWAGGAFGPMDLLADLPLPPGADIDDLTAVLDRGRAEISDLLRSFANEQDPSPTA
jgi:7-cyano-7-deazaguanine synthase in queuosine biosynthesis